MSRRLLRACCTALVIAVSAGLSMPSPVLADESKTDSSSEKASAPEASTHEASTPEAGRAITEDGSIVVADGSGSIPERIARRIRITGVPNRVDQIPGSADHLDFRALENQNQGFDDIHRILFRLPGINITEEDGYGLRPNIGMRGTGTERSASITVMEDGILAAPAPYSAPSAYYFPIAGRMEGVEVRKGSSQIKFGPRTNGGALNLLSTSVPDDLRFRLRIAGGEDRTRKLHASYGDARGLGAGAGTLAWLFETYQIESAGFKELPDGDNTGFDLADYMGKLQYRTPASARFPQEFTIKAGRTDETSHVTYLGLTEADFAANPYSRYAASQEDEMTTDHEQYSFRHFFQASENLDFTSTVYRNDFSRNWYKLDKVGGASIATILNDPEANADALAIVKGGASGDDALAVKANNRTYYSHGVEVITGYGLRAGRSWHDLEFGIRLHEDEEDRFQHSDLYRMEEDGSMVLTTAGTPGAAGGGDNRVNSARALALFAQDRIVAGDFTIIPGIRFETIDTKREQYGANDAGRTQAATTSRATTRAVVPGAGVSYQWNRAVSTFGGVHKGFAPPGPGMSNDTEAETSVNYELGSRYERSDLRARAVGFYNRYENLLGKDTFSSGGTGSGDLFNAGKVNTYGFETNFAIDAGRRLAWPVGVPVSFAYTYTIAEFQSSFDSDFGPWGAVESGDRLPYIPEHQYSVGLGLERSRWRAEVFGNYMSEMRTEAGQGAIPDDEKTDARIILDVTGELSLADNVRGFLSINNVFDETYNTARRPAGLRPGLPRRFIGGVKFGL